MVLRERGAPVSLGSTLYAFVHGAGVVPVRVGVVLVTVSSLAAVMVALLVNLE
jgi:hypothetical protein